MTEFIHKDIDGGGEYLPFAVARIKALRSAGLQYTAQSYVVGDVDIRIRIAGDQSFVRIHAESGGYMCLPHSTPHQYGAAEKPNAVIPKISITSSPPAEPGVDIKLKENNEVYVGGVDWRSADGKRLVTWGEQGSARYAGSVSLDIYENGRKHRTPHYVVGACALQRKTDGAHGYLYVAASDYRRVEFYFIAGGVTTFLGEYAAPASSATETHTIRLGWHFSPDATFAVGVLTTSVLDHGAYVALGTMLRADITNSTSDLSMTVAPVGGRRGGWRKTKDTSGDLWVSTANWQKYMPSWTVSQSGVFTHYYLTYSLVPADAPSGHYSMGNLEESFGTSSSARTVEYETEVVHVVGVDVVDGLAVLIYKRRWNRTVDVESHSFESTAVVTSIGTRQVLTVFNHGLISIKIDGGGQSHVAHTTETGTALLVGADEVCRAVRTITHCTDETFPIVWGPIVENTGQYQWGYTGYGSYKRMGTHSTTWKLDDAGVAYFDARYRALCHVNRESSGSHVIATYVHHNTAWPVITYAPPAVYTIIAKTVVRFNGEVVETVGTPMAATIPTHFSGVPLSNVYEIVGGWGGARGPNEAMIVAPPLVALSTHSIPAENDMARVIVFKRGVDGVMRHTDKRAKFTLGPEPGFAINPISIF